MTSKQVKPLASLFQQWSAQQLQQQQQQEEPSSQHSSNSYRLLLQYTNGLSTRITAAEAVENPHLYERAGVRTPAASANRDVLGGYAWLDCLVELAMKSNHVVWVATKTQPSPITSRLMADKSGNATVISVAADPWGWDEDCLDLPAMNNLQDFHGRLRECTQKQPNTVLVWESLTPLIAFHGFKRALFFLSSLVGCFQIWPIRIELLSPLQHQALEDAAQALLYLQGGDMTMIRQGIRERGNVIRKTLPFRFDGVCLVELENEVEATPTKDKAVERETPPVAEAQPTLSTRINEQGRADTGSSRKIQLKLDDEQRMAPPPATNTSRPRIFMQDDDPEFDDMDEEDPDDDLEI
eukprot:scaffold5024_cov136-Cylindrotheca_fusiformis.AAC.35